METMEDAGTSGESVEPPRQARGDGPSLQRLSDIEMQCIEAALARVNGNVTSAAHLLGISRHTIYRRLKGARS
jgi:transcriptional regulator of acetoin/glycerol metabolism